MVEELEQAARRAYAQSAFAAASLAFERAATLTPDAAPRGRRLTCAAESAWWAGRLDRVAVLLERARPLADGPVGRAEIAHWRGLLEMTGGAPADAYEVLVDAASDVASLDPDRALYLLGIASVAAALVGDDDAGVAIARRVDGLAVAQTPQSRLLVGVLTGLGAHFEGDYHTAAARLRSALELVERDGGAPEDEPARLLGDGAQAPARRRFRALGVRPARPGARPGGGGARPRAGDLGIARRPLGRARPDRGGDPGRRGDRRRLEARRHLRAALDGFEALGAVVWAERARAELTHLDLDSAIRRAPRA